MWKKLLDSKDLSHYLSMTSHDVGVLSHNQGGSTMPVDIHGKPYKTVAERVDEFHKDHPEGSCSIKTKIIQFDEVIALVRAKVIVDQHQCVGIFIGHAFERADKGGINATSHLENAETSAVGRALAFAGYGGSEIASADEVQQAIDAKANKQFKPVVIPKKDGTVAVPIVPQRKKAKAVAPPEEKLVKKPAEDKLFSFTAPDDMIMSDASAKQMGYLRVCLVRAGKESSPAFEVIDDGGWPTKEDVSNEIQGLVDDGYGSSSKEKPSTIIPIPPPGPEDPDDDDLPF
jgi:hypothetical protein